MVIDGKYFYKASVIRQLFDSSSASSDRLVRIRSLGNYKDSESSLALDNLIMLGDPILVKRSIAVVKNIKLANKSVKVFDGEKLQGANVLLYVQNIELTMKSMETGMMYVWTGNFEGPVKKKVLGSECNMIQPSLVTIEGKSCFAFDRN